VFRPPNETAPKRHDHTESDSGGDGPSFTYFTAWMVLCGCAFLFFGFETGKQSISRIDQALEDEAAAGGAQLAKIRKPLNSATNR
jgi:hypothetical protein